MVAAALASLVILLLRDGQIGTAFGFATVPQDISSCNENSLYPLFSKFPQFHKTLHFG